MFLWRISGCAQPHAVAAKQFVYFCVFSEHFLQVVKGTASSHVVIVDLRLSINCKVYRDETFAVT